MWTPNLVHFALYMRKQLPTSSRIVFSQEHFGLEYFGYRPDRLLWNSGFDIITFLLDMDSHNSSHMVLQWLLMAEGIWHERNNLIFNGVAPAADTLTWKTKDLAAVCISCPLVQLALLTLLYPISQTIIFFRRCRF